MPTKKIYQMALEPTDFERVAESDVDWEEVWKGKHDDKHVRSCGCRAPDTFFSPVRAKPLDREHRPLRSLKPGIDVLGSFLLWWDAQKSCLFIVQVARKMFDSVTVHGGEFWLLSLLCYSVGWHFGKI